MKISIITAAYNVENSINRTISSIAGQSYPFIEWIIVDGGSTDLSLSVYENNAKVITKCISEPDQGIYDAWNKGLKFITGDWVMFLGAGDYLNSNTTIEEAALALSALSDNVFFAYGNTLLISDNWQKLSGEVDTKTWGMGLPNLPAHPSVFHRASLFNHAHPFDITYRISADFKFLLANDIANHNNHLNITIVCMIQDGISARAASWTIIRSEKLRIRSELSIIAPPLYRRMQDLKLHIKAIINLVLGEAVSEKVLQWYRYCLGKCTPSSSFRVSNFK